MKENWGRDASVVRGSWQGERECYPVHAKGKNSLKAVRFESRDERQTRGTEKKGEK